ncbi:hypothetical protein [Azospirillum doebereinerae]
MIHARILDMSSESTILELIQKGTGDRDMLVEAFLDRVEQDDPPLR